MKSLKFFTDNRALRKFCEQYHIGSLFLFGSYARQEERENSDVDVLAEFTKPVTYFELLSAEEDLSQKLKKKVDLVTKNSLSPRIQPFVQQDMVQLI